MELWDIDSDDTNNTDSSYGLSGFSSESDSSGQNIQRLQKQLLVGIIFLNSFTKNVGEIPKKTFGKSSMFITASDLLAFNFTEIELYN